MKCNCTHAKAYCHIHSKIKMRFMIKDAYKNTHENPVFYSYFKEEKKPAATIIINMINRLEAKFKNTYNCILFFDNQSDTLLHKHTDKVV